MADYYTKMHFSKCHMSLFFMKDNCLDIPISAFVIIMVIILHKNGCKDFSNSTIKKQTNKTKSNKNKNKKHQPLKLLYNS